MIKRWPCFTRVLWEKAVYARFPGTFRRHVRIARTIPFFNLCWWNSDWRRSNRLFLLFSKDGYQPDGFATAKGLGGGLPLGAFVVSEKLANLFTLGDHGTTYGGNPLACATGLATVNHISTDAFLNHVKGTGQFFWKNCRVLQPDILKQLWKRAVTD